MVYENFNQLKNRVQNFTKRKRVAVVAADEGHTLEAVIHARRENIIEPVLIGNAQKIASYLEQFDESVPQEAIIHATDPAEAAAQAVAMVHERQVDFLMKGRIQTADLLRAVVDRKTGLRTGRIMSHVAFLELPTYHKLLAVTDGGMVLYPHLDEKRYILENAVDFLRNMGYECPKVAVLAAVETVNPKMQETVDALRLKHFNEDGELKHCIVEGPISYDLAMNKESAQIKGFESPVTGDVDIMLMPNITSGNLMAKALVYSGGARMAGVIVGASVPIVLTSRGSSANEKFFSLALSASAV